MMRSLRQWPAFAFALFALADLTAIAIGADAWRIVTKPALMVLLAVAVGLAPGGASLSRRYLVLALACSACGDAFLLGNGDTPFAAGTLCFALAHIAYITAFVTAAPGVGLVQRRPWLVLLYGAAWLAATAVLWPHLGAFAGLIVPYSALLTAMAVAALNLVGRIDRRDAVLVAAGALLFMSSDTNLALSRFDPALAPPFAAFVVMLTYIAAQVLIAVGLTSAEQKIAATLERHGG